MKELNKKKIISLTKITEPFLMVDNIKNILNLKSATGIKKVNKNSWFFKCHFTNQPMMPGTLIQETMLQTIIATLYSSKRFKDNAEKFGFKKNDAVIFKIGEFKKVEDLLK